MTESLEEARYISLPAARTICRHLSLENITDDALSLINSFLDDFLSQLVEMVMQRKRRLVVSTARSAVYGLLPAGSFATDCVAVADQMQHRTGVERGWPERPEAVVPGYVHERLRNITLVHILGDTSANNTNSHTGSNSVLSEADAISGSTARYLTGILEHIGRQLLAYAVENAYGMRRDTVELEDATRALHFDAQIKHLLDHMSFRDHSTVGTRFLGGIIVCMKFITL
ncbi:hypothetical protein BDF19DRAFT_270141 [Syncephalis fuscata]|nr:hypothetical protein BDF19DRAFT_270141 [Syncephalis fuscata]